MSKRKPTARRALEVTVVFEPSRLSNDHLVDAYAQVVPLRSHPFIGPRHVVGGADTDTEILASLKQRRRS